MKLLTAGVLALLTGSFSTGAQATEVCYRLDPFPDILQLEFGSVVNNHRNVYGIWIGPGYTLPVSGASEFDYGTTTVRRHGLVGTNATTASNNNLICGLDGIAGGGFKINCSGGPDGNFQNSGTRLTPISCAGLPAASLPPSPVRARGRAALAK
jgi:hypothetical protein